MMLFKGQSLSNTQYLVKAGQSYTWRPEGLGHARALPVGVFLFFLELETTLVEAEGVNDSELLEKYRRVPLRPF